MTTKTSTSLPSIDDADLTHVTGGYHDQVSSDDGTAGLGVADRPPVVIPPGGLPGWVRPSGTPASYV